MLEHLPKTLQTHSRIPEHLKLISILCNTNEINFFAPSTTMFRAEQIFLIQSINSEKCIINLI